MKSVVEIQEEAAIQKKLNAMNVSSKLRGKTRASSDDSGVEDIEMEDVEFETNGEGGKAPGNQESRATSASTPTGVEALRAKLRARVEELRQKKGSGKGHSAGNKDELLEERRQQRAALRENRRKELKEKKKKEREESDAKGKGKSKAKPSANGSQTKACSIASLLCLIPHKIIRIISLYPMSM